MTNGGFTVTINGGAPTTYTGMNFSGITNLYGIAPIVQQAMGLQGAAGPQPPTIYYTPEMQNKLSTHSAGQNYVFLAPTAGGSTAVTFLSAPGGGATDISTMLGMTSAAGAVIVPGTPVNISNSSITEVSARAMMTAGFCTPWTQGPVAQTMICADDTTARTYDIGFGDGYHPLRPRFYATFWPATGQVFTRFVGEQANVQEIEDLRYAVTLCLGNPTCTQVYANDLTGTGNATGSAITGLSLSASYPAGHLGITAVTGTPSTTLPGNGAVQINNSWMTYCAGGAGGCQATGSNQIYIACANIMTNCATTPSVLTSGMPVIVSQPILQWAGSTWTERFWEGGTPADAVNVDENLPYLESTRFLPNFDTSIALASGFAASTYSAYQLALHDMYDATSNQAVCGNVCWVAHQNGTGAQPGIGPYPYWDVWWPFSHGDYRFRDLALSENDIASFWGFNLRETVTGKRLSRADTAGQSTGLGHVMSVTDRKTVLTYNSEYNIGGVATGDRVLIEGQMDLERPFGWDTAHQPEPYFVPYVLLGDPFYLQELYLWAGYSEAQTTYPNRGPAGDEGGNSNETRSLAWTLRNRAETSFAAPDSAPEKSYFGYLTNDQLAIFEGGYHLTGTPFTGNFMETWLGGRLFGVVSNASNPDYKVPPPTGGLYNLYCDAMSSPQCSAIVAESDGSGSQQWTVGDVGSFWSDFMEFYASYALGRVTELGWAAGPDNAYHARFEIGLVNINPVLTQAEWSASESWNGQNPPVSFFDTIGNPTAFSAAFETGFIAATTIAFNSDDFTTRRATRPMR